MPDQIYEHPRLAAIYDALDGERGDLRTYAALVDELGAQRVVDVGCGTGTFALMLAERGREVAGVDPAKASLDVARGKPGADRVRWIHGTSTDAGTWNADAGTLTGNVAQAICRSADWEDTLRGVRDSLAPGGHLVLETRDPAARAWEGWTRGASHRRTDIPGVGTVESWVDLTAVDGPLVSFRWTYVFHADGEVLHSDSTLRFRERDEVEHDLVAHGYVVEEVRDAPDRPGLELVFIARMQEHQDTGRPPR